MWNLKDKTNEQTKQKQAQIHGGDGRNRRRGLRGTKFHLRNKLQHKEYSQ